MCWLDMAKINLLDDEYIILKESSITPNLPMALATDEVIFTNKNIIYINKGFFGDNKKIDYFSLDEIKIIDGKVQVFEIEKYNLKYLEIDFQDRSLIFSFDRGASRQKWIEEITNLIKSKNDSKVTTKCITCGAQISGRRGYSAKCQYCKSEQIL